MGDIFVGSCHQIGSWLTGTCFYLAWGSWLGTPISYDRLASCCQIHLLRLVLWLMVDWRWRFCQMQTWSVSYTPFSGEEPHILYVYVHTYWWLPGHMHRIIMQILNSTHSPWKVDLPGHVQLPFYIIITITCSRNYMIRREDLELHLSWTNWLDFEMLQSLGWMCSIFLYYFNADLHQEMHVVIMINTYEKLFINCVKLKHGISVT